jgi:thiamine-monophosphate kinase
LASLGLAHLQGKVELPEPWCRLCQVALEKPRPRVALGQRLVGIASAAIDVSDGLLADLGHIAQRSALAADVRLVQLPHLPKGANFDSIPRALALDCQLAGGDDYELCFTVTPAQNLQIAHIAAELELPLWCIGQMTAGKAGEVTVFDPDGNPIAFDHHGYEHFD